MAWGALADRQDMLRLLAAVVQVQGGKGLEGYEPPSAALAEALAEAETETVPVSRELEVLRFVTEAGRE